MKLSERLQRQGLAKDREKFDERLEQNRAVLAIGQTALKLSFVINGAAAIALLALIANLIENYSYMVSEFSRCIAIFGFGASLSTFSAIVLFISGYGENHKFGIYSSLGMIISAIGITLLMLSPIIFFWGLIELFFILSSMK